MPSKTYYPSYIMKGILTHNTLPTIEQRVGNFMFKITIVIFVYLNLNCKS